MAESRQLDPRVRQLAEKFAFDLTSTVEAVLAPSAQTGFVTRASPKPDGRILAGVSTFVATGLPLHVNGKETFRLVATYEISASPVSSFPAVMESTFKVYLVTRNKPLFALDYVRNPHHAGVPSAHYNIYADRRDMLRALARVGNKRRGKNHLRRQGRGKIVSLGDVHLPVGGHRFRPCLEDVLEVLVVEFGIDCSDGALAALALGRREWRRAQLRAAVSDDPYTAQAELEHLGFEFSKVPVLPGERHGRTSAL